MIRTAHPGAGSLLPADVEAMIRARLSESKGAVYVRFAAREEALLVEILEAAPGATKGRTEGIQGRTVPFSEWLKGMLRAQRMSQETAARRLGVSLKTVNRWVNGRTEPRMRELRRIQEAFGVAPPL